MNVNSCVFRKQLTLFFSFSCIGPLPPFLFFPALMDARFSSQGKSGIYRCKANPVFGNPKSYIPQHCHIFGWMLGALGGDISCAPDGTRVGNPAEETNSAIVYCHVPGGSGHKTGMVLPPQVNIDKSNTNLLQIWYKKPYRFREGKQIPLGTQKQKTNNKKQICIKFVANL